MINLRVRRRKFTKTNICLYFYNGMLFWFTQALSLKNAVYKTNIFIVSYFGTYCNKFNWNYSNKKNMDTVLTIRFAQYTG